MCLSDVGGRVGNSRTMNHPEPSFSLCLATLLILERALGPAIPAQRSQEGKGVARGNISAAVVELVAIGPGPSDQASVCSGTGFLVNEAGYLLTSAHFVAEARKCLAGVAGAKILAKPLTPNPRLAAAVACDVAALDEVHDLAVLKLSGALASGNPATFGSFIALRPDDNEAGTAIGVTGHPFLAWRPQTQYGHVIQVERLPLWETSPERSEVLVMDVALEKGTSGSPVYRLADGAVVGIVEQKDALRPPWSVAVSIRYAIELLDRKGIAWHTPR